MNVPKSKEPLSFRIYSLTKLPDLRGLEKGKPGIRGYAYIVESENSIKIGHTVDPYVMFLRLRRSFAGYAGRDAGRIAITPICGNYTGVAQWMRSKLREFKRPETDLFDVAFGLAVSFVENQLFLTEYEPVQETPIDKTNKSLFVPDIVEMVVDIQELLELPPIKMNKLMRYLVERQVQAQVQER